MRRITTLKLSTAIAAAMFGQLVFAADAAAQSVGGAAPPPGQAADTPAASPQTNPTPTAGQATTDTGGLGDIVVTAQRREENLQKAAIAITAVDSSTLTRAGVADSAQLTRVAPALQVSTIAGSASTFYVRGVGNFTTNSLSDAAVSFNVDGVAIARSLAAQAVFYDLERVEVLKGPQGTLYGRNSTGGAINVITAKPALGELSGNLNAEYGNYDAVKLTGALNLPLGDNGAVRIAGLFSNHDGYYTDGSGDDRTRAVRVQFASKLTDGFKLTVGGDYAHQGGRGSGATLYGLDPDKRIGITAPAADAMFASTFAGLAGTFLNPLGNDFFNDSQYWGMYAQADIKTPLGTLTVLPAYRYANVKQRSYGGALSYNEGLVDDQFSVETRLSSDVGRFSYILGVYYLDERAKELASYNQQYFTAFTNFLSRTKSYAGFGRLTYRLTDRFRLTGGVRYTVDDKAANLYSNNLVVVCPAVFVGGTCLGTPPLPNTFLIPPSLQGPGGALIPVQPWGTSGAIVQNSRPVLNPSKEFRKFTYRAGVEYDLGPRSLLYATYETGFKSGGFFSSIDDPVYQPETIDAITIGSKNRFFDNRLQINLEGFRWIYKGQQVTHFKLNSLGDTEFVTENVGKTRILGAEVEVRARVFGNTTLNATAQYLDAKYQNFTYANPALLGLPVTGCPFTPGANSTFVVDCSGRRPPNAPEWTLSGGIEQIVDLGRAGRLTLNVDARYQTWIYTAFEELPQQIQKGYAMLDVQATYEVPGSKISISGFANNLTNENVVGFSQPHPRAPSLIAESLRPPRTYGVRVGYKF